MEHPHALVEQYTGRFRPVNIFVYRALRFCLKSDRDLDLIPCPVSRPPWAADSAPLHDGNVLIARGLTRQLRSASILVNSAEL